MFVFGCDEGWLLILWWGGLMMIRVRLFYIWWFCFVWYDVLYLGCWVFGCVLFGIMSWVCWWSLKWLDGWRVCCCIYYFVVGWLDFDEMFW